MPKDLIFMVAIGVGLLILLGSFGAGAQANAAFIPAFNKDIGRCVIIVGATQSTSDNHGR